MGLIVRGLIYYIYYSIKNQEFVYLICFILINGKKRCRSALALVKIHLQFDRAWGDYQPAGNFLDGVFPGLAQFTALLATEPELEKPIG